jgi:hypothetical protein
MNDRFLTEHWMNFFSAQMAFTFRIRISSLNFEVIPFGTSYRGQLNSNDLRSSFERSKHQHFGSVSNSLSVFYHRKVHCHVNTTTQL